MIIGQPIGYEEMNAAFLLGIILFIGIIIGYHLKKYMHKSSQSRSKSER